MLRLILILALFLTSSISYRGDGLNVTSGALRDYLLSNYGTLNINELPNDPSQSIDLVILVEDADGGPHMRGYPHPFLWRTMNDLLSKSEYSHHRIGLATFDNKPRPGKGVGQFSNWYLPDAHKLPVQPTDWSCAADEQSLLRDSSCYTLKEPLNYVVTQSGASSQERDSFLESLRRILCSPLSGASTHSNSFDALISTVHDSSMGWRTDSVDEVGRSVPKLIIVFPVRKPENAKLPHLRLKTAMDGWQRLLTESHCEEPAIGSALQSEQAYGSITTEPEDESYSAVKEGQLRKCDYWTTRPWSRWQRYYWEPFEIDIKPYDLTTLINDPVSHCNNHEYPTSEDFIAWAKTLDDSWHIAWILQSHTDTALTLQTTTNSDGGESLDMDNTRHYVSSRLVAPDHYGFGDIFLKGRDPVLWQLKTMTRSARSPDAALKFIDLFIKWATLL